MLYGHQVSKGLFIISLVIRMRLNVDVFDAKVSNHLEEVVLLLPIDITLTKLQYILLISREIIDFRYDPDKKK